MRSHGFNLHLVNTYKMPPTFLLQHTRNYFPVFIIRVMLSPFRRIRPNCLLVFFFTLTSSASSRTKFIYSSKPMIRPSILRSFCSKSHI
uniref:Putative ovule protein n=1 Tax=Solanum chacoense TaxID=4108 RepID=A0A0V0H2K3_SOLCH